MQDGGGKGWVCVLLGSDFYMDIGINEIVDHARLSLQLSYSWYLYNFYNKHINGIENNFECIITTFNHRFSVFNICCSACWMICVKHYISTSGPQQTNIANP